MENWAWPQVLLVILWALSLGVIAVKHGQLKPEPMWRYNANNAVIRIAIMATILYFGGFW